MREIGDELPELVLVVTPADAKAYADASGDHNPLHQDDEVARRAGFPRAIAHGMFTMGHMAAVAAAFAGDPARVRSIAAQFRAPVYMGERIVAGGHVTALDDDTATLELWVRLERDGETLWPIKNGRAVIGLHDASPS